jgi:hypothetical protein
MSTPIRLSDDERIAALDAATSARKDQCCDVSTVARIIDAINRVRVRESVGRFEYGI